MSKSNWSPEIAMPGVGDRVGEAMPSRLPVYIRYSSQRCPGIAIAVLFVGNRPQYCRSTCDQRLRLKACTNISSLRFFAFHWRALLTGTAGEMLGIPLWMTGGGKAEQAQKLAKERTPEGAGLRPKESTAVANLPQLQQLVMDTESQQEPPTVPRRQPLPFEDSQNTGQPPSCIPGAQAVTLISISDAQEILRLG